MELKMLIKNSMGTMDYIYKASDKSFNESKPVIKQLFDTCEVLYMIVKDGAIIYATDVNKFSKNKLESLVVGNISSEHSFPSCFHGIVLNDKKSLTHSTANSIIGWVPNPADEMFFEKTDFGCKFPIYDILNMRRFFRKFFEKYGVYESNFSQYIIDEDEYDYEQPMLDSGENQNTIEFFQNQIEWNLNLLVACLPAYRNTRGKSRTNVLELNSTKEIKIKSELEFMGALVTGTKKPEPPQQEGPDYPDYSFTDKYDFASYLKK